MTSTATQPRDPGALSGPLAAISFLGSLGGAIGLAKSPYPRPGAKPDEIRQYYAGSTPSARISVAGQLASTASLARFTASVAKLAGRSGRGSRALEAAAIAGGGLAVTSLATSAVYTAVLTGPKKDDGEEAVRLHQRAFAAGGPVHAAGFGMLTGVLALAGLRTGELPRPLGIAGLVSATAGLLSPLYFGTERAVWFTPIGRFSGLVVSTIAGAKLSRRHPD